MKVLIIDGQGGGLGKQLVSKIKAKAPDMEVIAVGTNSVATGAMMKAGADQGATGENAVKVCAKSADIIMGPVGIVIADSLLGEITPAMASAIGSADAKRILIPLNLCDNIIVGVEERTMGDMADGAVKKLLDFYGSDVRMEKAEG